MAFCAPLQRPAFFKYGKTQVLCANVNKPFRRQNMVQVSMHILKFSFFFCFVIWWMSQLARIYFSDSPTRTICYCQRCIYINLLRSHYRVWCFIWSTDTCLLLSNLINSNKQPIQSTHILIIESKSPYFLPVTDSLCFIIKQSETAQFGALQINLHTSPLAD